jgi:hypothetical protein
MKRIFVLAVAAIGLVLPAAANAGAFQGVVIAQNPKRQAIVTTSANGTVRTVRAPKSLRKIGLGALVAVQARQLPDGTFAATVVRQIRRVRQAHVDATVVKRAGKKLFLSAGNSVFAFGLRAGAGAKLRPGDRVTAAASFGKAQLFCDDVKPIGHADQFELEGIYLSTAEGVLSLAVHGRGLVKVTVPDTVDLPTLKAGDEVSLVASVELDGTFTLVSLDNEDASDSGSGDSVDMGDSGFAVRGVLSSISPTSVGVRVEGHPEPVRCSVPPETNLSGFAVGQSVEMSCKVTGGDFVLVKLHTQTAGLPGDHNGSLDLNGDITALNSTAVTVAVSAESTPSVSQEGHSVLCALQPGADLGGFAIGDAVEVQCEYSKALGKYVLTGLSSDNATLSYGDTGLAEWFDLTGVLQSIRSDGVGIQVDGHQTPVNCAMPAGTDLSGFALGDTVELQCNFHDGKFNLASLSSDSAELTLE